MAKKEDDGMKEYVLKPGKTHIADGEEKKAGDKVRLSDAQAKAFADKFESVEEMNERLRMQDELKSTRDQQAKIAKALEAKGIKLEDLLAEADETNKNPPTGDEGKAGDDKSQQPSNTPAQGSTNKVEPPKTSK